MGQVSVISLIEWVQELNREGINNESKEYLTKYCRFNILFYHV